MKELKVSKETRTTEERTIQVPELCWKKDSVEMFMIDFREEKLIVKGICFVKRGRQVQMQLYPDRALIDIMEKEDATEAEWNQELAKVQEFLQNF